MEYKINKNKNEMFGVIGVCGVAGNLVARVLMDNGYDVLGSDLEDETHCKFKYALKEYDLPLHLGSHPKSFFAESDFIIPPPSISVDSDFYKRLKTDGDKFNYEILTVDDVLNIIQPEKPVLCITGTNGKTTTVSLLKHMCRSAGLKPAEHGFVQLQGNIDYIPPLQCRLNGDVAVLETGTFGNSGDLKFIIERSKPDCGIITNITPDHMHHDQDFLNYVEIKGEFVDYLKDKKLIVNGDDPTVWGLIKSYITDYDSSDLVTFGVDFKTEIVNKKTCICGRELSVEETIAGMGYYSCPCGLEKPKIDYLATDIGENSFILNTPEGIFKVKIPLIGLHNIYNTLGAIVAAKEFFKIPLNDIISSIETFKGVPGRLDYLGEYHGQNIIIDYAHNPGGVETMLRELKKIYQTLTVVITVSSESGEKGDMEILNKCMEIADYVIPASYKSRKATDKLGSNMSLENNKIILTPKYPEEYNNGTLGANFEQIEEGINTALQYKAEAVVCIGEAAFKYIDEIRKYVE